MAAVGGDLVRSAEWRQVRAFAETTRAAPAALAVQGEVGAGRSTLWRTGIQIALAGGYRPLRSEPSASETGPAFVGLSDLLAGVLPRVADQIPGPQREALEIALLLPPAARAVGPAVLAVLGGRLAEGPVLVAIDDVQWLEALTFAARRVPGGPLSLLVPRTEAAADPLTAGAPPPSHGWRELLAAIPAAGVIDLAPLDMWQVQNLLPRTVTTAQAREVARQSRGNPFWALQVSASLESARSQVPPLARTLTDRLSRWLSAGAAAALAVVAAAGRRHVQLYRRLADASPNPERYAHFTALAADRGPDSAVAEALDAAAAAAHARAANAAAAQFATQALEFTPASDDGALVRRRIRAGELLFLASEMERSREHLEALDIDRLATDHRNGRWRCWPTWPVSCTARPPPRPSSGVPLTPPDQIPAGEPWCWRWPRTSGTASAAGGGRRAAAIEAISCAETAGPAASPLLHHALINLAAKVSAAEELDTGLLERAERLEAALPAGPLHNTADVHRGVWARCTDDVDTARAALQRSIARAREAGEDYALLTFLSYLAATQELARDFAAAAAALAEADQVAAVADWPMSAWHLEPRCELLIAAGDLDRAVSLADERLPDQESRAVPARFIGESVRGKVSARRGDAAAMRHFKRAA